MLRYCSLSNAKVQVEPLEDAGVRELEAVGSGDAAQLP